MRTTQFRTGSVRQPEEPQFDLSVNNRFYFNEQWPGPNTNPTDPNFGWIPIGQRNIPRQIQPGFRLTF